MTQKKTSNLESINLSPLNTSKSKAMYSFSKASRFPDIKQLNSSLYEKTSTLSKRATSFGFGDKTGIISKHQYNPSPDRYNQTSIFEKSPKKGISIGIGRQDCKNITIYNKSGFPAPTQYKCDEKENSPIYSMRSKVKLPVLFFENDTPGPGKYENDNISKNGQTFISKYKSLICFRIHGSSPRKIEKQPTPILGPMTYDTVVSSSGKQPLSKNRTEKSFRFDKKERETFFDESFVPGPGTYSSFSPFSK